MRILALPAFSNRASNPYNSLLYSNMCAEVAEYSVKLALTRRFDILHLHWPESELNHPSRARAEWRCQRLFWILDFLRFRGCKVVWTIHNLSPHERYHPALEKRFYRQLISRIDGYVVLSRSAMGTAQAKFPELQDISGCVIPHGHYRDIYPTGTVENARDYFGIPSTDKVILYFGQLREYKNIPGLITAFRNCKRGDLRLIIAGRPLNKAIEAEILGAAQADTRISVHSHHIKDEDVQLYFQASNLVALPYRDVLNSGAALLALSFDKPVLVPNLGAMPELAEIAGSEWVRTYDGDLCGPALLSALDWASSASGARCLQLENLHWKIIADKTLTAFKQLAADHRLQ